LKKNILDNFVEFDEKHPGQLCAFCGSLIKKTSWPTLRLLLGSLKKNVMDNSALSVGSLTKNIIDDSALLVGSLMKNILANSALFCREFDEKHHGQLCAYCGSWRKTSWTTLRFLWEFDEKHDGQLCAFFVGSLMKNILDNSALFVGSLAKNVMDNSGLFVGSLTKNVMGNSALFVGSLIKNIIDNSALFVGVWRKTSWPTLRFLWELDEKYPGQLCAFGGGVWRKTSSTNSALFVEVW
jgi:hypothetical protein